jgi:hypothetical protein
MKRARLLVSYVGTLCSGKRFRRDNDSIIWDEIMCEDTTRLVLSSFLPPVQYTGHVHSGYGWADVDAICRVCKEWRRTYIGLLKEMWARPYNENLAYLRAWTREKPSLPDAFFAMIRHLSKVTTTLDMVYEYNRIDIPHEVVAPQVPWRVVQKATGLCPMDERRLMRENWKQRTPRFQTFYTLLCDLQWHCRGREYQHVLSYIISEWIDVSPREEVLFRLILWVHEAGYPIHKPHAFVACFFEHVLRVNDASVLSWMTNPASDSDVFLSTIHEFIFDGVFYESEEEMTPLQWEEYRPDDPPVDDTAKVILAEMDSVFLV